MRDMFKLKRGVREYLNSRPNQVGGGYGEALNQLNKFIIQDEESREKD
jgi:hypothetical protein